MRFYACLAFIVGASAIKLHQESAISLQVHHTLQRGGGGGPREQSGGEQKAWEEVEAWVKSELKDGGTITKEEAYNAINNIAAKHGVQIPDEVWEQMEGMFDMIDTNNDGELDAAEVEAVVNAHENVEFPTEEEIMAWVEGELAKDGSITWDEIEGALDDWAASQNYTIPDQVKNFMKESFKAIDTDNSGDVDRHELEAAFAHHEQGHDDPRGPEGPTEEEIKAWLEGELAKDGDITMDEIKAGINEYASAHNIEVPQQVWDDVDREFKKADTDGNGAIDRAELDAAFARHAEGH